MIRQHGKPTAFLTMSANETRWPQHIRILHRHNDYYMDVDTDNFNRSMRSAWVNEDPVTCCIYFNRLVVIMRILMTKQRHNPFGQYRVVDYFLRIEFQHRASSRAHLLWLDNEPRENVSEDMPQTIRMMTDVCSVESATLKTTTTRCTGVSCTGIPSRERRDERRGAGSISRTGLRRYS
jgi:hypothetical protein